MFICDDCSQIWQIAKEGQLTNLPPRFCPACGAAHMREIKGVLANTFKGRCFAGIDPQLVLLLFSVWRQQDDLQIHYPRFVDYIKSQLEA